MRLALPEANSVSSPDAMDFIDLYAVHEKKAWRGLLTIHPARWLHAGGGLVGYGVFDLLSPDYQAIRIEDQLISHFKELSQVSRARHKHAYYFATPAVAKRYCNYLPKGNMVECAVQDILAIRNPEGRIEVHTPVGFIDLLLPKAIIEIKRLENWKHALGQVLAYSAYYPNHAKVIHLYSQCRSAPDLKEPTRICQQFGVDLVHSIIYASNLVTDIT